VMVGDMCNQHLNAHPNGAAGLTQPAPPPDY